MKNDLFHYLKNPSESLTLLKTELQDLHADPRSHVISTILSDHEILSNMKALPSSHGEPIPVTTIIWKLTQTLWKQPLVFENKVDLALKGICELLYLILSLQERLRGLQKQGIPIIGKWPANPTDIYYGMGTIGLDPFFSSFCLMLAEGDNQLALRGRAFLSEDSCPAQAAAYMALEDDLLPMDYFYPFIGPWCYDSQYCFEALKKKIAGDFGDHPIVQSGNQQKLARSYMQKEIQRFIKKMEELTGKAYDPEQLRTQISLQNKIRKILREIASFTLHKRPPLSSLELMICTFVSSDLLADPLATYEALRRVRNAAQTRIIAGEMGFAVQENPIRLLITGIAPGDLYVYVTISELGGIVVGSECVMNLYFEDINDQGDPVTALTDRFLSVPYTLKAKNRAEWTLKNFQQLGQVDGVIYNCNFGCNYQAAESRIVCDTLKEAGVPCLITDADLPKGNRGQLRTRIEAFIEMLRQQRA